MTYSTTNSSDRTEHQDMAVTQPGLMKYTIYVEKNCHCVADIMIVVDGMEVDMKTVSYSKSLVDVVFNLLIP